MSVAKKGEIPLLAAFASLPIAVSTSVGGEVALRGNGKSSSSSASSGEVAQKGDGMTKEWRRAEREAEGNLLEEVLLSGEEYFLVPDQPRDKRAALPPASPMPKVRPYKRLSFLKRRIVALHLQGEKKERIAKALGIPPSSVTIVLRNPTTQAVIAEELSLTDDELAALKPLVVDRLRTTLRRPSDQRVGLQAIDLYMKSQHQYKDKPEKRHTAEDMIQEILKIRTEGAADITIARQEVKGK
jgi:hypothetical protein